MDWLDATDARLTWHNVEELYPHDGGRRLQRVAEAWRSRFPDGAAWRALQSANVSVRFYSDSPTIAVRWKNMEPPPPTDQERWGDALCNGVQVSRFAIRERQETAFASDGGGLWEVHFPWAASVVFEGLGIEAGYTVSPQPAVPKSRWLAYGDSITQGFTSYTARGTWVWIASQELGWEPINMGFGGAGLGEEIVARYIASRGDWDRLTLAFGINNSGRGDSARRIAEIYEVFLSVIRAAHPGKPVQCITPIVTIPWDIEGQLRDNGERVQDVRDAIADVVRRRVENDPNLSLVDGLSCVHGAEGLEDDVHPDNSGMREFADRVVAAWKETG